MPSDLLDLPEWLALGSTGPQPSTEAMFAALSHATALSAEAAVGVIEQSGPALSKEECFVGAEGLLESESWQNLCERVAELPTEDRERLFGHATIQDWASMVSIDEESLEMAINAVASELTSKCHTRGQSAQTKVHETLVSVAGRQIRKHGALDATRDGLSSFSLRGTTRAMIAKSAALAAASLAAARRAILREHATRIQQGITRAVWISALQQSASLGGSSHGSIADIDEEGSLDRHSGAEAAESTPGTPIAKVDLFLEESTTARAASKPPQRSLLSESYSGRTGLYRPDPAVKMRVSEPKDVTEISVPAGRSPKVTEQEQPQASPKDTEQEQPQASPKDTEQGQPSEDVASPKDPSITEQSRPLASGMVFLARGARSRAPPDPAPSTPNDDDDDAMLPAIPASLPIAIPRRLDAAGRRGKPPNRW